MEIQRSNKNVKKLKLSHFIEKMINSKLLQKKENILGTQKRKLHKNSVNSRFFNKMIKTKQQNYLIKKRRPKSKHIKSFLKQKKKNKLLKTSPENTVNMFPFFKEDKEEKSRTQRSSKIRKRLVQSAYISVNKSKKYGSKNKLITSTKNRERFQKIVKKLMPSKIKLRSRMLFIQI